MHVWRVDVGVAVRASGKAGSASRYAIAPQVPEFVTTQAAFARQQQQQQLAARGGHRAGWNGSISSVGPPPPPGVAAAPAANTIAGASIATQEGLSLIRRLVYDASEGGVVSLRHYDSPVQSVLAVALEGGVVHGCDLRARTEAWAITLPRELGSITAMEVSVCARVCVC